MNLDHRGEQWNFGSWWFPLSVSLDEHNSINGWINGKEIYYFCQFKPCLWKNWLYIWLTYILPISKDILATVGTRINNHGIKKIQ